MENCNSVIRRASQHEAAVVLEIGRSVQDKLTHSGSAQQLAGYFPQNIAARIDQGELSVLEVDGVVIGSAFVEPVAPERFPQIASWDAIPDGCPAWFLYGLVVSPDRQGQSWGRLLLQAICCQAAFAPPAVLLLDCWAGNQKLRRFYSESGFYLHGVFPEGDYEIAVFRRPESMSESRSSLIPGLGVREARQAG